MSSHHGSSILLAIHHFAVVSATCIMKALKYREAFQLFNDLDWDTIRTVSETGSKARRIECAHGQLQTLVFRLTDRPDGDNMSNEEMNMFC